MNSEPWKNDWEKVWQQQPLPEPGPNFEQRLLADVRRERAEWDAQWTRSERTTIVSIACILGINGLGHLFTHDEIYATEILLYGAELLLLVFMFVLHSRRRRIEREFDQSLLSCIKVGQVVLRSRMRLAWGNVFFAPLMAAACASFVEECTDFSEITAAIVGGISFIVFTLWFWGSAHKWRMRYRTKLEQLEKMQRQLIGAAQPESLAAGKLPTNEKNDR